MLLFSLVILFGASDPPEDQVQEGGDFSIYFHCCTFSYRSSNWVFPWPCRQHLEGLGWPPDSGQGFLQAAFSWARTCITISQTHRGAQNL